MRESELYQPIKAWLEAGGYTVHAEVRGADIAARRGNELVLVEMKRSLNLELLLQIVRGQEAAESVYAAVPAPAAAGKRWRELTRLLKRLEAGLILVRLDSALPGVEVAFHPIRGGRRRNKAETGALLAEMSGRSLNLNLGGSNRRKIVTAYRERALKVAVELERLGPASPKALRAAGTADRTGAILRDNHYGWFERLARGQYGLSRAGERGLAEYGELARALGRGKP
ncbi:MAG: DUF2161 family putative PD-(D/E)XK-type phosphodiesterase [Planctomycetota bacterium]|jgi:hypothetical protein|nr:DUF2161 family putative PD-(D/E)XK-type phosphodiesterase [Planctomycetota bacterium]